jgi:hypothetical protein
MVSEFGPASVAEGLRAWIDVQADPKYLAPMRDGKRRLREPLPDGLRQSVLWRDRFMCCECPAVGSETLLQVDHLTPVAAGGSDRTDNLRTLCERCNTRKLDLYTIDVACYRPRLIVTYCYDCRPPEVVDEAPPELIPDLSVRVFCATCRHLKTLTANDAEDRELSKYFQRA